MHPGEAGGWVAVRGQSTQTQFKTGPLVLEVELTATGLTSSPSCCSLKVAIGSPQRMP